MQSIPTAIYALCAITSLVCFGLLLRAYLKNRVSFLLWCSLCFCLLALQNIVLFIDLVLVPQTDLSLWRTVPEFVGMLLLLYGLVWESR